MGVTLTGKVIKDTYDGILKFEDNQALSSSLRRITDGLGNDTSMKISSTQCSFLNVFNERSITEITNDSSGNVVTTRDYVNSVNITNNSYAKNFTGDGTQTTFTFANPYASSGSNVMIQVYNVSTGSNLYTGITIGRVGTNIVIDFQSPVVLGLQIRVLLIKVAAVQQ